ncbi:molybdopterin synthase catalytic subunit-like [Tigriopus californicus]|uniref:molybdopterin synthase catalytic subunit-like n=1 Tax=Tigriopus californicus TaxID=6832 RepID=UPI0027DA20E1|nr:molybdopterin synthase catalytic subunit-like [Tigriopus californicus]|eukprot:TCALIF_09263-PA protein Name:"Similar to Mocs2 Molybdopterin synthase catalytic subunit (Drosophila yakuba)" AED:0.38 eAED:0.38 QI:0/-1/0/1/-1/1/1/0/386
MTDSIKITGECLHISEISNIVTSPSTGATSLFIGTTRDNFDGKTVLRLEYEAYIPMAEKELKKLCSKVRDKWNVANIAIHHRIGVVPVTEASVVIAISSAHRQESLEAVHFAIDELKATVPIWKKEVYEGESNAWKENKECKWKGQNFLESDECDSNSESESDIDPKFVQVVAPKSEIDRRMQAFIQRKRDEINNSNVLEFCNRHVSEKNDFSCARTDAVLWRQNGSSSHLRQTQVVNAIGPQTENYPIRDHASLLQNAPFIKSEDTAKIGGGEPLDSGDQLPEGVRERFQTLEKKLILERGQPVPKDVYARLKLLEDHVRRLEGTSPEYLDLFQGRMVVKAENDSRDREANEERREVLAQSLTGLNTRIQELQASLRVKSEPTDK